MTKSTNHIDVMNTRYFFSSIYLKFQKTYFSLQRQNKKYGS